MSRIRSRRFGFALILLLGATSPAYSKDLNVLVRILYAAFIAEQGATICMVPSVRLSDEDRIVFTDAKNYGLWMKEKISADLSAEEVLFILRSAADKAKDEMDEVLRVIKSYPRDDQNAELTRWCMVNMKKIAFEVVGAYVNEREKLDKIIEKSKQD